MRMRMTKNNNTANSITDRVIGYEGGDNSYYDNLIPSSAVPIVPLVVDAKTLIAQLSLHRVRYSVRS
jgi:hypothetical protein